MKAKNFSSESVTNVINMVKAEGQSLGAIIRNFVAVANEHDYARYMLDCITGRANSHASCTINEIKKAVIINYPTREGSTLLEKKEGIYQPIEVYTAKIIERSFYVAVGHKKPVTDLVPASAEEVAAAKEQAEHKRAEKAAEKAAAKEKAEQEFELYKKFYTAVMEAADDTAILEIVRTYKAAETISEKAAAAL